MALDKFIPVGLGAVTLLIIFSYTMWKSPIKNFSVFRKKYLRIKSKASFKREKIVKEVINIASSDEDNFDDVTDVIDDTDDEFHDAQEIPFEQMSRDDVFRMVDSLSLKEANFQLEALHLLRRYETEFDSNDADFLWRIAQAIRNESVIEKRSKNFKKQTELLIEARTYAKKALDLNAANPHVHKWYGLLCGELAQNLSIREQVNGAKIFKEHLKYAYSKLPEDYLVNYALGTFEYEASSRSYLERTAAKLVFGKLFEASRSSAIEYLTTSERIRPCKRNRLCLARCYLHDNILPTAHTWLRKAVKLPTITPDDFITEDEILEGFRNKTFKALENLSFIY